MSIDQPDPRSGLGLRADYDAATLLEPEAAADPYVMFDRWLADAEDADGGRTPAEEFNSMALATVDPHGQPTVRNVLLRAVDGSGRFEFFTNRDSRKGTDIAANDRVCLLFSWLRIHRQVRVEGTASPLPDDVSDRYFAGRPRQSRIGAWASEQSRVIADRAELDARVAEVAARFDGGDVPRPPNWGGYGVTPTVFEFWQGRPSRLHDRLRYRRDPAGGGWIRDRLAP